MYIFWHETT